MVGEQTYATEQVEELAAVATDNGDGIGILPAMAGSMRGPPREICASRDFSQKWGCC